MKIPALLFLIISLGVLTTKGTSSTASSATASNKDDDEGQPQNLLRGGPNTDADGEYHYRVLAQGPNKVPSRVKGNLGNVGVAVTKANSNALRNSAALSGKKIVAEKLGVPVNPNHEFQPKGKPYFSKRGGSAHVRLVNVIRGQTVEGASVMVHIQENGTITGMNGEIVTGDVNLNAGKLPPTVAIDLAVAKAGLSDVDGECVEPPKLAVVRNGASGDPCYAWKCPYFYETTDELGFLKPHRDEIFAEVSTGYLCAVFPRIYGALELRTLDCQQRTRRCNRNVVSTSTTPIITGDDAADAAHNYAIATHQYYLNNHGRDSIDDNGMELISRVHYSKNYNNAFWDGSQMTYGDGDGTTFIPLSMDADVVAHELTHGVTERTSNLIYRDESGALNEAMSDIFGAMVDEQEGATGADIWLIGEDIYTPGTPGDALRNMAYPSSAGDYDWYPSRYQGSSDNGGVHWNSGIANLAFVLLSDGGKHPADRSPTVTAMGIGMREAANVFYEANVACLTSSSDFEAARYCTAEEALGGIYSEEVHLAWDAVGVPDGGPPPPPPPPIPLVNDTPLSGQEAPTGNLQQYTLNVPASNSVTCTTLCNNGDADLYLRFGAEAEENPNSSVNECGSYSENSNESCTSGVASSSTTLYAAVHAYNAFNGLTIECTLTGQTGSCTLKPTGASCEQGSECCSGSCKGKPGSRTCK